MASVIAVKMKTSVLSLLWHFRITFQLIPFQTLAQYLLCFFSKDSSSNDCDTGVRTFCLQNTLFWMAPYRIIQLNCWMLLSFLWSRRRAYQSGSQMRDTKLTFNLLLFILYQHFGQNTGIKCAVWSKKGKNQPYSKI